MIPGRDGGRLGALRRAGWRATASLAAAACGLCVAAPASGAAPAAPAPPPAPSTVPAGGPAPTVVPPIPPVPTSITDGQDPAVLLQRALALTSVGVSQAPLEAQLARSQQVLDGQAVAADHAAAAARAATGRARAAEEAWRAASASAASLQGALREAALRLYIGGTAATVPTNAGTTPDEVTDAAAYEETILSPEGILQQRRAEARAARDAVRVQMDQQATALRQEALARSALAGAAVATDQIRQELAGLGPSTATLVAAERSAVSDQAGQSLTSPSGLEFTPSAPLPAPLPTTSVALAWAFSELGRPYLWGGTGPAAFDCSGLTQYSWAHAGVAIPRVAADQDSWTVPVPLSQLLPGDLVFFGTTDIHHVGMYIGDGLMINAPHTGDVVRVSPIWWSDLSGFGRVHAAGVPVPVRALPAQSAPAPPVVRPSAGAVPSESSPPPGYVAPPGATAPVAPSTPARKPSSGSTTTTAPATATTTTTTPPATTPTTVVSATSPTTAAPLLGLGG